MSGRLKSRRWRPSPHRDAVSARGSGTTRLTSAGEATTSQPATDLKPASPAPSCVGRGRNLERRGRAPGSRRHFKQHAPEQLWWWIERLAGRTARALGGGDFRATTLTQSGYNDSTGLKASRVAIIVALRHALGSLNPTHPPTCRRFVRGVAWEWRQPWAGGFEDSRTSAEPGARGRRLTLRATIGPAPLSQCPPTN